jgi:hypothetical protein
MRTMDWLRLKWIGLFALLIGISMTWVTIAEAGLRDP